jgi:hypothetical protein
MTSAVIVTVATGVDYVLRAQTLRNTSPRAQAKREGRAAAAAAQPPALETSVRKVEAGESAKRKAASGKAASGKAASGEDPTRHPAEPEV